MLYSRRAPAAANYSGNVGLVVMESAVTGECVLAGAAAAAATGALLLAGGGRPLGIVTHAENRLGGLVTIAGPGEHAFAYFTGIIAKGAGDMLMSDANSQCVVAAVGGANTQVYSVGQLILESQEAATVAGGLHKILVTCDPVVLA